MAPVVPSLSGPEAPVQGKDTEDATEVDAATKADGEVQCLSLERPWGVYQHLLRHLFANARSSALCARRFCGDVQA